MRKCWNCGQPTTDNDLRVCSDPICGRAAISSRLKLEESREANRIKVNEYVRKYRRERYHRPEVKAKVREYHQRPEVKEKKREYNRKRSQRPEVKERQREYMRKYRQRPEVKERRNKRQRERYHRLKELREEE